MKHKIVVYVFLFYLSKTHPRKKNTIKKNKKKYIFNLLIKLNITSNKIYHIKNYHMSSRSILLSYFAFIKFLITILLIFLLCIEKSFWSKIFSLAKIFKSKSGFYFLIIGNPVSSIK